MVQVLIELKPEILTCLEHNYAITATILEVRFIWLVLFAIVHVSYRSISTFLGVVPDGTLYCT